MPKIRDIKSFKIINSRADWTILTKVILDDGSVGVETVPDGASKGQNESVCLPAEQAALNVSTSIKDLLVGKDPFDQKSIDDLMIKSDGTANKSVLGGNAILSVSLAVVKACANSSKKPLYRYLAELYGNSQNLNMPTPVFNIINGGKHAQNNLSFQEFMVIPSRSVEYDASLEIGVTVYQNLKKLLTEEGLETQVGDEGGFAPESLNPEKALQLIKEAAQHSYAPGKDVFFGMDVAAESFWSKEGYSIKEIDLQVDRGGLKKYYSNLLKKFELIYIEDPYYEKDFDGWQEFYTEYHNKIMVVADDLVVTNTKFLNSAIQNEYANAVIVKPNQVGTLSETFDFVKTAQKAKMSVIVSHRSGDTAEDAFIADLGVAVGADFIKSGAPARGERVAKYNRLLEIYHELFD